MRALFQEKGQALALDLPGPLPHEGDPRRLEQVVVNLLANAHRHTPAGTRVTIAGRAMPDEIVLSVADSGPGIPAGELEAIFRRFHRLPPPEGTQAGGSGLGLAIAKAIVELHGGRMWAESRRGHGTTFYVTLPRYRNGALP